MTGLQNLLGRFVGRSSVALVLVAAVVALAPMAPIASATPEGDADAAITQVWDANGGDTGTLGPKDGGVYAVGAGFGQNFAGGRIYFTPETGARIMQGAILDKYLALGGPAEGDLGFPNIDEGAGRAPDSRNTTFSAVDKPVIFFTPDTGARVVRGAINAAWDALGGSAGVLGVPTEDEVYRGEVVSQKFTGGELSWNRATKTFTTTPPELADQLKGLEIPGDATSEINAARRAAGGPLGPLGAPDGPPQPVGDGNLVQAFSGGKIFYSPDHGADVITGQLLEKYESVGGPTSDLGFPIASEADGGLAPASRIAKFAAPDEPVIFWTPDFGAVIVRGAMNAAWAKLGGATGDLGAPTADQTENGDVITQKFANGAITFDRASNEFSTEPPNLANALAGLAVPGQDAPRAPQATGPAGDDGGQPWYQKWWWALALIPVLVLVGAVVVAVILNRRRGEDRAPMDRFDDYDDYDDHDRDDHDHDDHDDDDEGSDFVSGPMPSTGPTPASQQQPYVPLSAWAMPKDDEGGDPATPAAPVPPEVPAARSSDGGFSLDQDAIDTTPNRIVSVVEEPDSTDEEAMEDSEASEVWEDTEAVDDDLEAADAAEAVDPAAVDHPGEARLEEAEAVSGPPSGRHAAIQLDEPAPAQTSLRLASDEGDGAPAGYPIKADTKTGLYWLPGSEQYDRVKAEVWFASEEFALTNGFVRG
jgi:uncharacterized protein with LGFP repeats